MIYVYCILIIFANICNLVITTRSLHLTILNKNSINIIIFKSLCFLLQYINKECSDFVGWTHLVDQEIEFEDHDIGVDIPGGITQFFHYKNVLSVIIKSMFIYTIFPGNSETGWKIQIMGLPAKVYYQVTILPITVVK